jgi:hypothetical protein
MTLKIKNEKGISFVPKGAVSINISNIVNGEKYTALDAGTDKIGNTAVRVVKLLPVDDNADIVLSTIYIDEANLLIKKAKTTSHTILSPKPDKHSDNDNVLVRTQARILSKAITPIGRGFKIIPIIVAINIISKCQASSDTASDIGRYQAANDKLTVINRIRLFF